MEMILPLSQQTEWMFSLGKSGTWRSLSKEKISPSCLRPQALFEGDVTSGSSFALTILSPSTAIHRAIRFHTWLSKTATLPARRSALRLPMLESFARTQAEQAMYWRMHRESTSPSLTPQTWPTDWQVSVMLSKD